LERDSPSLLPENLSRKEFYSWMLKFARGKKAIVFFIAFCVISVTYARSIIPVLIGKIVDKILVKPSGNVNLDIKPVIDICLFMMLLVLVRGALLFLLNGVNDWLAFKIESEVREEFYETIQSKPLSFHDSVRTGDVMALATNDTRQMSSMISPGIRLTVELFVSVFFVTVLAFTAIDIRLAALCLIFIPPYIWGVRKYGSQLGPISRVFRMQFSDISVRAQDSVVGAKIVRAFSGEEYEEKYFEGAVKNFRNTWKNRQYIQSRYYPSLILYLAMGLSTVIGAVLVINGEMTLGQLIAFNGLLMILDGPTQTISFALAIAQGGLAGAARIYVMMSKDSKEDNDPRLNFPEKVTGRIQFKDVTFSYDKESVPVLKNLSFTVEPGETVAIVGPTGCGKTTLTKLLLRFYDPDSGCIELDGIDIRNYGLTDLRSHVGHIEQDVFLFSTSIKNNIAFGKFTASISEIKAASNLAQAHEFISSFKDGYDTVVGERGFTLSGGQRQRIAIARAFLTNPDLLILDDSTSAIDSETEEKIVNSIETLIKGRTSFIITHRVNTIIKADRILVLKKGRLVAQGKHDELILTSPDYRRIFSRHLELPPLIRENSNRMVKEEA